MTTTFSGDELAGILELFDALTVDELTQACSEVVFKETGESPDDEAIAEQIDDARESFHLVTVPDHDPTLLVPGPVAFPTLPTGARDLPHILDIPDRSVDRTEIAESLATSIESELEEEPPEDRIHTLVDLTYDLESWAAVDVSDLRAVVDDD